MIQADLIVPPIVAGFLMLLFFGVKSFMMETSIDSRVTNGMQETANIVVDVLQEELKQISSIEEIDSSGSLVRFVNTKQDTVTIRKIERKIELITRRPLIEQPDTLTYDVSLEALGFVMESATFLRVMVSTASLPEQHARRNGSDEVSRGFAERRIYLRNLDLD
ncbi:MAG: hypothetical protein LAT84_09930 [Balneolia bacterium]|nr:hypothetical protein [Balneolia bacterium]